MELDFAPSFQMGHPLAFDFSKVKRAKNATQTE